MSKYHIVGNHMSRLIIIVNCMHFSFVWYILAFSRNANEVPASGSTSCGNVSLTSVEEMSEDILNERHVGTQTRYRSYRKVTAALKRRHQREMLRLKRQARLMKRQLTSQCK